MDGSEICRDGMIVNIAAVAVALGGFPLAALFLYGGGMALAAEGFVHLVGDAHHEGRLGAPETKVQL